MSQSKNRLDLVPVHGGLEQPVDRVVPLSERAAFLKQAGKLPKLRVTRADLSTVYRISDGALSPLEGPMRGDVYTKVLERQCIEVGGKRYAWTIPLALPIADDDHRPVRRTDRRHPRQRCFEQRRSTIGPPELLRNPTRAAGEPATGAGGEYHGPKTTFHSCHLCRSVAMAHRVSRSGEYGAL